MEGGRIVKALPSDQSLLLLEQAARRHNKERRRVDEAGDRHVFFFSAFADTYYEKASGGATLSTPNSRERSTVAV